MKKRMTILALLLAGAVTLGSYGMVQAGQEKREVPVAGVTQTLAQVLKEAQGVQAQTADAGEELQSNAAVARMMEPEMVAEEAWETAEIAENELPQTASEFADIAVAQVNHYVNVLILDEPTDHLDMESITALNNGLIKFPGVILFASRDHQVVQTTANRIIEFLPDGTFVDKVSTYDEYLENDEMARKRQVYSMSSDDEGDN